MSIVEFVCDSDLHFKPEIRPDKADHVQKLLNLPSSVVLLIGDLTNNGSDGSKGCFGLVPISGKTKQLQALRKEYIEPLESHSFKVYCCMGNHDDYTYFPYVYKAVEKFIKKKHGGLCYTFYKEGLRFICLGKCPTEGALRYLKDELQSGLKNTPTVLFFHYNLQGPWSDWWKDSEKEAFYQVIKDYNIILIANGHIHKTEYYKWKGIPVVTCGGAQMVRCTYCSNTNPKLNVDFI
jgi:UDP-2,3-diacylglucosamine pyrophosphatase LpxH